MAQAISLAEPALSGRAFTIIYIEAGLYDNWSLTCIDGPIRTNSGKDIIQNKCEPVPSPARNQLPDNCKCLDVRSYDYK